jgi:protein-disulfide isomerase
MSAGLVNESRLKIRVLVVALLLSLWSPAAAPAAEVKDLPREAIEEIIHDYILKHPEVILDSVRALQERQRAADNARSREAIAGRRDELLRDPDSPVGGNHLGELTVVEFFDYRCPACKAVAATVKQLIREDPTLRIVYKEFPILGEESVLAAKAALAAQQQGKYSAFHEALMQAPEPLSLSQVLKIAAETGLDVEKLKTEMESPKIQTNLAKTRALAQAIGVNSTPTFVVGDDLVRGTIDLASFKELVRRARSKSQ